MATPEEQVGNTEEALKRLTDKGHEWLTMEQVALQAMIEDQARRRAQRSRIANSIRDLFSSDSRPRKPSFRYRHQTSLAFSDMRDIGRLEQRFMDEDGHLRRDPPLPRSADDLRYRLVDPETAGTSPLERFEAVAARIGALPEAESEIGEDDGVKITRASAAFGVGEQGEGPHSIVSLDSEVIYHPGRKGAEPIDPASIWVRLEDTPAAGGAVAEAYINVDHLGAEAETGHTLDFMENALRAVELSQDPEAPQDELAGLHGGLFGDETIAGPDVTPVDRPASLPPRSPQEPYIM